VVLSGVVVLAVSGLLAWRRYTGSPVYALRQVQAAARERNRLKFERYVDLQRFSTTTVDEMLARATLSSMTESKSGFAALGAMLGASMLDKLKPALASEMRGSILKAVENGRFDKVFAASNDSGRGRDVTLASVARNVSADQMRFESIGEARTEGDVATVDLRFRNERLDTTLVLRLRLERGPEAWRIVAPDNLRDYLQTVDGLQQRRLAEVNRRMRQRLNAAVEVGEVRRGIRTYEYYSDDVVLSARVRNIGKDTIDVVLLTLVADEAPIDRGDMALGLTSPIPPGEEATAQRTLDYNRFIDWHRTLRYSDRLRAEPWAIITRRGAQRDTLWEYGSWSEYTERQ
jgi:hypothetical protein